MSLFPRILSCFFLISPSRAHEQESAYRSLGGTIQLNYFLFPETFPNISYSIIFCGETSAILVAFLGSVDTSYRSISLSLILMLLDFHTLISSTYYSY